jgi:hypothetical protein
MKHKRRIPLENILARKYAFPNLHAFMIAYQEKEIMNVHEIEELRLKAEIELY